MRENFACGIRNPGKFFLVESGMLDFGIRNTAQGIWNPAKDWNPESKGTFQKSELAVQTMAGLVILNMN